MRRFEQLSYEELKELLCHTYTGSFVVDKKLDKIRKELQDELDLRG
jgi:hypothetical protein